MVLAEPKSPAGTQNAAICPHCRAVVLGGRLWCREHECAEGIHAALKEVGAFVPKSPGYTGMLVDSDWIAVRSNSSHVWIIYVSPQGDRMTGFCEPIYDRAANAAVVSLARRMNAHHGNLGKGVNKPSRWESLCKEFEASSSPPLMVEQSINIQAFKMLGIESPSAIAEVRHSQINQSYLKLARRHHPDMAGMDDGTFGLISEAKATALTISSSEISAKRGLRFVDAWSCRVGNNHWVPPTSRAQSQKVVVLIG